jgi:hypothetical protein
MLTLVIAQRFKLRSLKLPIRSLSKTNGKNLIFESEVFNHKKIDGMTQFYALSLAHVGKTLSLPRNALSGLAITMRGKLLKLIARTGMSILKSLLIAIRKPVAANA